MNYYDYIREHGPIAWPYPIEYDKEERIDCDVLVIGAGLAGSFAAASAARKGARVVILEKGGAKRSGAGGAGIDHWNHAATNPASEKTPDEMMEITKDHDPFECRHLSYIAYNESWECLEDFESWGLKIRDVNDDFKGAPFRDEATKLLFWGDSGKTTIRHFGAFEQPVLYNALKKLGVRICDRCMATMLLTENGKPGSRIIGATAVNNRTGKFYVISAKATVVCTRAPVRLWSWGSEKCGSDTAEGDPNCAGDTGVLAWKAGIKLAQMERTSANGADFRGAAFGSPSGFGTWWPCEMEDAEGNAIPWVDYKGDPVTDFDDRGRAKGQEFAIMGPFAGKDKNPEHRCPNWAPDIQERINRGEFPLPFFGDLTVMPWYHRRSIFGHMVGNEGKTRTPVLRKFSQAGFDPEKDVMQTMMPPAQFAGINMMSFFAWAPVTNHVNSRDCCAGGYYGGIVVDWNLKSSSDGLYAAGNAALGAEGASTAAATGRYAGRNAAVYASTAPEAVPVEEQVAQEKQRIYAVLANEPGGKEWKEIQLGMNRVMQDYCGKFKNDQMLDVGLWWMDTIRDNELADTYVNNPHDLSRVLDTGVRLEASKLVMIFSKQRKTSCDELQFWRLDHPEKLPVEEEYYVCMRNLGDHVEAEKLPLNYWKLGKYAGKSYAENYRANCCK